MAARMRAAQAPIVILNHALLAVHASLPNGLMIGDFDSVVIDEAHAFEDAATQAFGFSAAGAAIHHFLDRAPVRFRTDQRHWEDAVAALGRLDQEVAARLGPEATRLDHPLLAGLDLADALDALARDLDPEHRQPGREYAHEQSPFALPDEVLRAAGVEETALERLARQGADLADRLRTIAAVDDPLLVYHVESGGADADPPGYTLLALPLDVAPYLSGWWEAQASILTSATLSDGHSFSFVRERLGLSDARPHELVVPSPFDYAERTRLVLTPVPGQDRADAVYFDELAMQMARLLDSAGGKALLLFTSHRALDAIWKRLQVLRLGGWRLVRQGELSPARVRDVFAEAAPDARIAVFASRSWWQGVDLPGMRLVVMDKLPFPQLGDPMVAARSAEVEQQEGHVFLQYLLPLALIAFRQGFGRLMRGEADFGAVAVCDARLGTRSYGARFLAALPTDIPVLHSADALRAWVRTHSAPGSRRRRMIPAMPWNPDRYLQFERERAAPFADLLALIAERPGLDVVDLGCGTGELTRRLAEALPDSRVLGIDSSPEMLARAEALTRPGLRFAPGTIETVAGAWDVVFSHAAIQWVPDHPHLVPHLLGLCRPGGRLAVQLPSNHDHATHRLIAEIAGEAPFCEALGGWTRESPVLGIDAYATLLFQAGGTDLVVFEKVYPHLLADADALADWTQGTTLVPYFERLPAALHAPFLERYRARLRALWPAGPVFYGFRRTLFAATRPAGPA